MKTAKLSIESIGKNQTELTMANGAKVLFSYSTPVAALVDGKATVSSTHYSTTTSKHVNAALMRWGFDPATVPTVPQAEIDALV